MVHRLLLPASSSCRQPCGAAPLRVVTLSTVLTEIATEVGGPEVAVTGLVRPGVDPHTFEAAPADLRALVDSDLIFASGLGLENTLDKLAANSGTRARIVDVSSGLAGPEMPISVPGRHEPDPHWWNSIAATEQVTRRVAAELTARQPDQAAGIKTRADAYLAQLTALDRWTREQLAVLPTDRRQLVTTHDAFGWFARDYGFTVHPVSGVSPEDEPNARDFANLVDLIRRERIPAVFVESSANPSLIATIARETGAKAGGSLYADGLSADGDGTTYDGMVRHNIRTLVAALSGPK